MAAVYALVIIAPLAHVDGAVLRRLFDARGSEQSLQIIGEGRPQFWQKWL